MYKYTWMAENQKQREELTDLTGRFNDFPPGWRKLTAAGFAKGGYAHHHVEVIEFRQMYPETEGRRDFLSSMTEATLHHTGKGRGWAMTISRHRDEHDVNFFVFDASFKFKEAFDKLEIISDTQWEMDKRTSIPHRGFRDYNRTITFKKELSANELESVVMYLKTFKCPGYTGVKTTKIKTNQFKFRTTCDSSD